MQVVISTGIFKLCAQVKIAKLTWVHNLYLYLLKKKTSISKNIDKFNKPENEKTRLNL